MAQRAEKHRKAVTAAALGASQIPPPPVLTIPGAAGQLGCSEMHIYRLLAAGVLRAVDISMPGSVRSKTRIRADDLADYIERQTRSA